MPRIAQVLIPLPLPEAFDYAEPEELRLTVGDLVAVPLGSREVTGVVMGLREGAGVNRRLKPVGAQLAVALLPEATLKFIAWAARYCVDLPGQALAMTLRGHRSRPAAPVRSLVRGAAPARTTPARERVLAALENAAFATAADLARAAGVSAGVVRALIDEGAVTEIWEAPPDPWSPPDPFRPGARLNPSQAAAVTALNRLTDDFAVALLDGVTGSGKTEVYLEVIAERLREDPTAQILVLMPEIALTQAALARFAERFGATPVEWHSDLAPGHRRAAWEAVTLGTARIVVGARSALFLPFVNLRLIVVDEEHDAAYKQEDGFIYHARDLAVVRARLEQGLVILASATPSLESLHNAQEGRYHWLRLSERHGAARLPDTRLIDMRETPPPRGGWLSPVLAGAVEETLGRGEQALLFLNRRGYAPLVLCRACGERLRAPDSDSWLVEHRYTGRLVCHLTGFSMPKPDRCPTCDAEHSLISVGPGVERIEEEARRLFPDARIAVFSSDTLTDAAAARTLISAMTEGEIDLLIATQAAAKGHDFPNLTLVGVVDADLGLRGGDLRAAERTFQLVTQVAGRAGRRDRPGRALIQTWTPDHPVMRAIAAGDRDAFCAAELEERRLAGLPPFTRLAAVILSAPDGAMLQDFARAMASAAPNTDRLDVFGPADAPIALVRGRRRMRFLVRASREVDLSAYMATWRARVKPPASVRLAIDIDPYTFL
jgi:primosomal protein N' (replication factor Y) (superfamily II helicase)